MAKSSGLGDRLYVAGRNLSNDIAAIQTMHGGPALLNVTGIDKSAIERIGGQRDGSIEFTTYLNDAAGQQHATLSALPTTDVHVMYTRGTAIGNGAACLVAKQADYKLTRSADGALMFDAQMLANGYGIEMDGRQLTAGLRTDTAATNGASDDELGGSPSSTAFGWSAYLQCTAFSGTDCTIKLQDSADNSTFADITGAAFTQLSAGNPAPFAERIQSASPTATVRRYVRVVTTTSGGFSSVTFAVVFIRALELRSF